MKFNRIYWGYDINSYYLSEFTEGVAGGFFGWLIGSSGFLIGGRWELAGVASAACPEGRTGDVTGLGIRDFIPPVTLELELKVIKNTSTVMANIFVSRLQENVT